MSAFVEYSKEGEAASRPWIKSDNGHDIVLENDARSKLFAGETSVDELSREVYCILGLSIDAIDLTGVIRRLEAAATNSSPFLLSTPNLNYLINGQEDREFRQSLLLSDLCPADGMPIVWLGWLLGVRINSRVAGSDIFAALKSPRKLERRLKLFLFGGAEGVAAAAARALNASSNDAICVGSYYPGFCSVEELSQDVIIDTINSSGADFLVVSLGAKKGQTWLAHNHHKLKIPIRAHLGATLNFEAGTLKRAPIIMQKLGFEWLWRIKEEPYLWRRYWHDGSAMLRLLYVRVLPVIIHRFLAGFMQSNLTIYMEVQPGDHVKLRICGAATN